VQPGLYSVQVDGHGPVAHALRRTRRHAWADRMLSVISAQTRVGLGLEPPPDTAEACGERQDAVAERVLRRLDAAVAARVGLPGYSFVPAADHQVRTPSLPVPVECARLTARRTGALALSQGRGACVRSHSP
jgi:hypothetical protein